MHHYKTVERLITKKLRDLGKYDDRHKTEWFDTTNHSETTYTMQSSVLALSVF